VLVIGADSSCEADIFALSFVTKEHAMTRLLIVCATALAIVGIAAAQAPTPERPDPRKLVLRGDRFKPSATMR
jgi:hypothetical protein